MVMGTAVAVGVGLGDGVAVGTAVWVAVAVRGGMGSGVRVAVEGGGAGWLVAGGLVADGLGCWQAVAQARVMRRRKKWWETAVRFFVHKYMRAIVRRALAADD